MKKLLSLALLCMAAVTYVSAHTPADVVALAEALKGKQIDIPACLVAKKHELMALKLRVHAQYVRKIAARIEDPWVQRKYVRAAEKMDRLADTVEYLPAVDISLTLKHPERMLWMKARKAELKGKMLQTIGKDLNDEKIVALGAAAVQWAKDLRAAIAKSKLEQIQYTFETGAAKVKAAFEKGKAKIKAAFATDASAEEIAS